MTIISKRETVEGGRAAFAFASIKTLMQKQKKTEREEFRTIVKKMPSIIQVNGLGQTLAFFYANIGKKQYSALYAILDEWAKEQFSHIKPERENGQDLVEWVISLSSSQYKMVTMEYMALLNWLRRFAEGMANTEQEV